MYSKFEDEAEYKKSSYIPRENIDFIHRFYFEIEYFNNEGKSLLIIDDIPYISTSIFQSSLENGYIIYEILN